MTPDWTQVLRFAPRTELRFSLSLSAHLRTLLEHTDERASRWFSALDQATLKLAILEPHECTVQGRGGNVNFELAANRHAPPQEGYRATMSLSALDHQHGREFNNLVLMLGGTREAIIAQRNVDQITPYVRLRYPAHGNRAEVALYTPALAPRLPHGLLTMLPNVLVVGELQSLP